MVNQKEEFESKFGYESIQDLCEEGKYRRYTIPQYLHSNKGNSFLLKQARDIFRNNWSFDGDPVYKIVFEFSVLPPGMGGGGLSDVNVRVDKDYLKCDDYLTNLIKVIDSMGLFLVLGLVWTYTDKQRARSNLSSWRNEVLKEEVCACCGGEKHLEAHHIFGYATHEELRDDPQNGIALCKWCHKKYHSYFPGDANPKDLINFLKRFGDLE